MSTRYETTLIYRQKEDSEHTDHRQYSVFMSNRGGSFLKEYGYRWDIENGYKSVKRFMAATKSKNFVLRFFYFAFACLLYSIWRAVDLLVHVDLTDEYERSSMVTADNRSRCRRSRLELADIGSGTDQKPR